MACGGSQGAEGASAESRAERVTKATSPWCAKGRWTSVPERERVETAGKSLACGRQGGGVRVWGEGGGSGCRDLFGVEEARRGGANRKGFGFLPSSGIEGRNNLCGRPRIGAGHQGAFISSK